MTARQPVPSLTAASSQAGALGWDRPLVWLAAALVILGVGYGLVMLALSRREPRRLGVGYGLATLALSRREPHHGVPAQPSAAGRPFFVFLMPCLNEAKVIGNSLQRLLSMPSHNFVVMVIDDGSDDGTAEAVSAAADPRVWLLRRTAPSARQGKGEALNAAIRHLTDSGLLAGRGPGDVIIAVVDADGRLDPHAISAVTPYFADPVVGAVQIGVRINNRDRSRLARMQDMEFVIYTEVFQRGRRHLGSVGLGGNGQFVRLSALASLGPAPWTRSLTEDLDLGVRLLAEGWRNEYCASAAVHQQGVVELGRLLRQRSRWFQGHLQSWKLIPVVLRSVPRRARADMLYHLSSPALLLIASLLSASFLFSLASCVVDIAHGENPAGWWIAIVYALVLGPALAYGHVYWIRERDNGLRLLPAVWLAHLYVSYSLLWFASGWWAVGRTLRRRTGWAKTERVAEAPGAPLQTAAVGTPVPTAAPLPIVAAQQAVLVGANVTGWTGPAAPMPATPMPATPMPAAPPSAPALAAPSRPGEPARPSRHGKPRRRRLAVAGLGTVLAVAAAITVTGVLPTAPVHSQWLPVFNGGGATTVTGSGASQVITLRPATALRRGVTHAGLVISAGRYRDVTVTATVRTVRQLRHGAAGSPNAWEVGWVLWHYTGNQHFYALTLEPTGWVLSKQDPAYPGAERFLASGRTPRFGLGIPHHVQITQAGSRITVAADGHLLTQFTDTQRPYLTGATGLYSEDSQARFSNVQVTPLPAHGQHA